jgi:hypothetical protein
MVLLGKGNPEIEFWNNCCFNDQPGGYSLENIRLLAQKDQRETALLLKRENFESIL